MLRFINKLILLLIPLSIALYLLKAHFNSKLPILKLGKQTVKVHDILVNKIDTEIPIFGSSVAYSHFNPAIITEETKKATYNFGLDGTTLVQYNGLLKEYINYSKSEIIVIAGTASEFYHRDLINEFDNFKPYIENDNIYEALFNVDPELVWKVRYVPFYDFMYYGAQYRAILTGNFHLPSPEPTFNGFHPAQRTWADNPKYIEKVKYLEIDTTCIQSYQEIINAANARGKKVVLVLTPILQEAQKVMTNIDEVRALYKGLAGENNYFIDFTVHPISNNKELFYNYSHMNAEGANLFSKEFSKSLFSLGIL